MTNLSSYLYIYIYTRDIRTVLGREYMAYVISTMKWVSMYKQRLYEQNQKKLYEYIEETDRHEMGGLHKSTYIQ
jgi:hypothetical protein